MQLGPSRTRSLSAPGPGRTSAIAAKRRKSRGHRDVVVADEEREARVLEPEIESQHARAVGLDVGMAQRKRFAGRYRDFDQSAEWASGRGLGQIRSLPPLLAAIHRSGWTSPRASMTNGASKRVPDALAAENSPVCCAPPSRTGPSSRPMRLTLTERAWRSGDEGASRQRAMHFHHVPGCAFAAKRMAPVAARLLRLGAG